MFEWQDNECVREDADDDGGHPVEQVRRVAHHKSDRTTTEFRQVNSAEKSNRNSQQACQKKQFGASHDSISHASAGLTDRGW